MNKPSFLSSTLSLAFILCVSSVIMMIFLEVEPDKETFGVIGAVVGAYLGSRMPNSSTGSDYANKVPVKKEEDEEEKSIHDISSIDLIG